MQKLRNQNLKIQKTTDALIQQERTLTTQIEEAEDRLPALLASHALGEITGGELSEERQALIQLKLSLKEIPLTLQGLEARHDEIKGQLRVAQKHQDKKDAEKLFNQLKPQFEKRYNRETEDQLRSLAVTLGTRNEVEPYLQEARERFEKTPLGEL